MAASRSRAVTVLRAALPAVVLAAAGGACAAPPPAGDRSGAPPAATAAAATARQPSPAADRTVRVAYAAGRVTGETGTVPVPLGSVVHLVVTSDVADEVHLHGYDKSVDVPARGTATLTFSADIPGGFEVELEKLGQHLLQLRVG